MLLFPPNIPLFLWNPTPSVKFQWSLSITVYLSDPPHPTGSCEQCPPSWLPFQGSCYYFSETQATWDTAQSYCGGQGAHLVIVRGLNEQVLSWDLEEEKQGLPELVWPRTFGRLGQLMCLPTPSRAS